MSEKYKFADPNGVYFVTSTVVFWIDLFTRKEYKYIVEAVGATNESRKEWLLRAFGRAGQYLKRIEHNKLWQDVNHPILLDSAEMVRQKADYIHYSPVKDEIVDEPE